MRFGETPIDEAAGAILAHSWRASGVNFSKGRVLSADDVAKLKAAGASTVVAARLDPDDVHEDEAAAAVARALAGEGIEITAAFTGRCNHFAKEAGLAVVDHERIDALNELDESVTVATLPPFARVEPRQMVATVKIIPYAAPRTAVARAIEVAKSANQPLVSIAPFKAMRAGLVQTRLPGTRDKVLDKAVGTTGKRLTSLGSALVGERRVTHDAKAIAGALRELRSEGCDIFLIAGASAIVDRHDVVPAGIEQAGGKVTHFGMPVDPGNLLLTAELDGKPVLGLPGCAKSPKYNGFDMVLERLAAGLPVGRAEIVRMGAGGLLAEIPSRPQPRDDEVIGRRGAAAGAARRRAGAGRRPLDPHGRPEQDAGRRQRPAAGRPCREGRARLAGGRGRGRAGPHGRRSARRHREGRAGQVAPALRDKPGFRRRPQHLGAHRHRRAQHQCRRGHRAAGRHARGQCRAARPPDGGLHPVEGRSICVPTVAGKRGNPVLWARRFFPEMSKLAGDTGAKHLIGEHGDLVCEVEMAGEAAVTDIDTPEALAAWRERSPA